MSQEWLYLSASELGRFIGKGEIDPLRLTEVYLEAIDGHPLRDRIYARVTHDRALAEAGAASARAASGQRLGLLDGVPISWKDLFDTAGIGTEAGTAYFRGRVPERDALVVQNATAAGLVCLGKTHMSELAFSGLGYNPITATPPCVNDEAAVPGGSSSGAAASVAFGLAAAGIGSDTGGSVRIPAAWNDLTGLKTTHGLLSLEGVVPLAESFDTVGPLCRSVEDAGHLMAALGGTSAPDLAGSSLAGRRLLVLENVACEDLRPEVEAAFKDAVARLGDAGARIEHGRIDEVSEAMPLSPCLFTVDAYARWRDMIEADPLLMYHQILDRFRSGAAFSGIDYVQGWTRLRDLRRGYLARTAGYDAVLLPTAPILPPDRQRLLDDGDYYISENLLALRNTRIGNLMGLCGLSLPTGTPSVGAMLLAAPGSENRLLRLGAAAEAALG
ncbi:MAG: amidase [Rhodobacteraceae bacterium]|nr:amidase [Paracoccaceae bacterium]